MPARCSASIPSVYSSISRINTTETNIMTAEDPVEFNLMGVNQVQVRENIGLNFAAALRSFLRQDPNTILVGEIRDFETAEIAVKAALTGHLVLSTLHTNDAPSTVNRLMNMGIEPFLVASSLNLVCAQRLVRRICKNCSEPHPAPPEALMHAGFNAEDANTVVPNKGKGCEKCNEHRLQGPRRVVRSDGDHRGTARADPGWRVGPRVAPQGRRGGHDHAARQRPAQSQKQGMTTVEEVVRETVEVMATLPELLQQMVSMQGSDLHITTNTPPTVRVHGKLTRLEHRCSVPAETKQLSYSVLTDAQKKRFEETLEIDLSFGLKGLARFRCNMFNQRGAVGAVYR